MENDTSHTYNLDISVHKSITTKWKTGHPKHKPTVQVTKPLYMFLQQRIELEVSAINNKC